MLCLPPSQSVWAEMHLQLTFTAWEQGTDLFQHLSLLPASTYALLYTALWIRHALVFFNFSISWKEKFQRHYKGRFQIYPFDYQQHFALFILPLHFSGLCWLILLLVIWPRTQWGSPDKTQHACKTVPSFITASSSSQSLPNIAHLWRGYTGACSQLGSWMQRPSTYLAQIQIWRNKHQGN